MAQLATAASIHSPIHRFVRSFVRSPVYVRVRSFVRPFVRSFVRPFVRSFVGSFFRSCSFDCSLVYVRSFVRSGRISCSMAQRLAADSIYPSISPGVRSFVRSSAFFRLFARREKNCRRDVLFDDVKNLEKQDRVDAIVFVQKSSKSELSSQFLGRLKIRIGCLKICRVLKVVTKQVKCRFGGAIKV